MKKTTNEPRQFYSLPIKEGTSTLTLETLNKHSDFRLPAQSFLEVKVRAIAFKAELLTLGVIINDEPEERLFLIIRQHEILVSCNKDTSGTYLSRHAYFGLFQLTYLDGICNFKKYYWPDFFDKATGESKYLDITKDMHGIRVSLKPSNNVFYKPGQSLFYPVRAARKLILMSSLTNAIEPVFKNNVCAIGYCLADTNLNALHTNHFPFLVPYSGVAVRQGNDIKQYIGFIKDQKNALALGYTPTQQKLNELSFKMADHARIMHPKYGSTEAERTETVNDNASRMELLFALWQEAIPLLQVQLHKHYLFTYGMKNVTGRPVRKDMQPCVFMTDVPELYFLWIDKGEYYELEMRFKVGNELFVPNENNTAFFLNSKEEPLKFYLLGSPSDYKVASFFAKHQFKLSVLKLHYQGAFEDYIRQLSKVYEFNNIYN